MLNHNLSYIVRTSEPNKLDTVNYGTICKVVNNSEVIYYIQLSNDSENPKWAKLDIAYEDELAQKISELLK